MRLVQGIGVTEARNRIGTLVTEVVNDHRPIVIDKNKREHCILIGVKDVERMVGAGEFHPEVSMEEGAVNVWLPEFALYGRGADFAEARSDLTDEVRIYVKEYLDSSPKYSQAPNRADHYPLVIKAMVADLDDRLEDALFAPPQGGPAL